MKKKMTWDDRLVKWFYNVPGVVDEHLRAEAGRFALRSISLVLIYDLVSVFCLSLYAYWANQVDFEMLFYVGVGIEIFGLFVILLFGALIPMNRLGVTRQEVSPAEKPQTARKLRRRWLRLVSLIFVLEWLLNTVIDYTHGSFWRQLFSWSELRPALGFVLILGGAMYGYERWHIRTVKDED